MLFGLQGKLLKYHVLGSNVLSKDIGNSHVETLDTGSRLQLMVDSSGVRVKDGGVNTARVTQADTIATNGIIHYPHNYLSHDYV